VAATNFIQLDDTRAQLMNNAKVAVLHSGLLARKGEALPMATFGQPTAMPHLEDPPRHADPVRPPPRHDEPVHHKPDSKRGDVQTGGRQEPVVTSWQTETTCEEPGKCSGRGPNLDAKATGSAKKKVRAKARKELHARLDITSHTRLKIAAARLGRSQQEIVEVAIDTYLDQIESDCRCMQNVRG
jgi:hypothetical protein